MVKEITRATMGFPWSPLYPACPAPGQCSTNRAKDHRDPHRSHATHIRSHNLEAPEPELTARPLAPNALFCSFFYVMLPCPAQNPPWLPVDHRTKSKPPKWRPWLLRAKPRGTWVAESHGERVEMPFPPQRAQLGLSPVMRLPPRAPSIS